jgi:50S ribosomal protein L16 3-hydroxylase
MPDDSVEVELTPSSLLFVPRGYWHSTRAAGESVSLNFTYSQPTWLDVVQDVVRRRLMTYEQWRQLANGSEARGTDARVAQLLEELRTQLCLIDSAAVLGEAAPTVLQQSAQIVDGSHEVRTVGGPPAPGGV